MDFNAKEGRSRSEGTRTLHGTDRPRHEAFSASRTRDNDSLLPEVTRRTTEIKWNGELANGIMGKEDKLSPQFAAVW